MYSSQRNQELHRMTEERASENSPPPPDHDAGLPSRRTSDLGALVESLEAAGFSACLSPEGTYAWFSLKSGSLTRLPLGCTEPVSRESLRQALSYKGVWLVNCAIELGPEHRPNCFEYICTNPDYDVGMLSKQGRRDVRRGQNRLTTRPTTWDELIEHGLAAYNDTAERHGLLAVTHETFAAHVTQLRQCPFFEIWGAWNDDGLAAWNNILKVDDWAQFQSGCSHHSTWSSFPNNVLHYEATRTFLCEEKRRLVSLGFSNIEGGSGMLSLHKFKLRAGFTAVPRCRVIVPNWKLRPFVSSRICSRILDRLARGRPTAGMIGRLANISRVISGRLKDPLAWVDEASSGKS
jgi:hypothetical protein